ncbi:MAG: hypothetical protein Q8P30_03830 [Candidatus Uhrbacteria bacterium]|nr:hypothetical protein [Candidatus Uhrbacteria bacterium]
MNEAYTYYSAPLTNVNKLESLLVQLGYSKNESGDFIDGALRTIHINQNNDSTVEIGIPSSNLLDELEQLEFFASSLDLDIDDFQKVL